jgi:heavy metal sensor kinase
VLTSVVAGFALILYYETRSARRHEIDSQLVAAANYIDSGLRPFPPHDLEGDGFVPPPPPEESRERIGPPPWPGPPPREHLLANLVPPNGDGLYFAIWRIDGSMLSSFGLPSDLAAPNDVPPEATLLDRGSYREAIRLGPRRTRILVGRSLEPVQADLAGFAWRLAGAGGAVLLAGLLGGWLISSRIIRPIAAITATASRISATNLTERIDAGQVDSELADLARVLNGAFERLQAAFDRQTQFTADASHELRTPLAVIRSHAELALSKPRPGEEYQQALGACLRAARRMSAVVDALLTLARADAGKLVGHRAPLELDQLVDDSVSLIRALADNKGVALTARLVPVRVVGNADALSRLVGNLLDNAVRYTPSAGKVEVVLEPAGAEARLTVADTGSGIPLADQPHIFERFYRVDKARSRGSGGTGLGLAICKSIVEAHGGTIGFESKEGVRTTFWVRLPCVAALTGAAAVSGRSA